MDHDFDDGLDWVGCIIPCLQRRVLEPYRRIVSPYIIDTEVVDPLFPVGRSS